MQQLSKALLVGGVFDEKGGRASGYFKKLASALEEQLNKEGIEVRTINGGTYAELEALTAESRSVGLLLWFADVPNTLPKLLPVLMALNPAVYLVTSKNNRSRVYSPSQLHERMLASGSELLVEFTHSEERIFGTVHGVDGRVLLKAAPAPALVAWEIAEGYLRQNTLVFPLNKHARVTTDSESFTTVALATETEVPLPPHPGAFLAVRKNHQHEGIDLYGLPGDAVLALEAGVVVYCGPFTGPKAGSPWWADTQCVMVRGMHGVFNYGEISLMAGIKVGAAVKAGQPLGKLKTVLLKDKGRPMTMLHLERYTAATQEPLKEVALGSSRPPELLDPTRVVLRALANKENTFE